MDAMRPRASGVDSEDSLFGANQIQKLLFWKAALGVMEGLVLSDLAWGVDGAADRSWST
jgi:hypothetical protein